MMNLVRICQNSFLGPTKKEFFAVGKRETSHLSTANSQDESLHWTAICGLLANHPDPSFYDDEELCLPQDEQDF